MPSDEKILERHLTFEVCCREHPSPAESPSRAGPRRSSLCCDPHFSSAQAREIQQVGHEPVQPICLLLDRHRPPIPSPARSCANALIVVNLGQAQCCWRASTSWRCYSVRLSRTSRTSRTRRLDTPFCWTQIERIAGRIRFRPRVAAQQRRGPLADAYPGPNACCQSIEQRLPLTRDRRLTASTGNIGNANADGTP